MAAQRSEVTICNQALTWLGQDPIMSLADQNDKAEWCAQNYPHIRDAVLEERMWTFSTARAISETGDRDEWDSAWKHPVPAGWSNVFRVYQNQLRQELLDGWVREGDFVLVPQHQKIYMWGSITITDVLRFSELFTQALATRIAAEAAIPFTENRNLQADMWAMYAGKLADAASKDGQVGSSERIKSNVLLKGRNGGSSWW